MFAWLGACVLVQQLQVPLLMSLFKFSIIGIPHLFEQNYHFNKIGDSLNSSFSFLWFFSFFICQRKIKLLEIMLWAENYEEKMLLRSCSQIKKIKSPLLALKKRLSTFTSSSISSSFDVYLMNETRFFSFRPTN